MPEDCSEEDQEGHQQALGQLAKEKHFAKGQAWARSTSAGQALK